MKRIGFIVNSRLPEPAGLFRGGLLPHHLLTGWDDSGSPMSFMRFRWIAEELRRQRLARYELYRPWRRYDAVVLLKSMGEACLAFARRRQARGGKVVFEANVDYYTETDRQDWYLGMAPTAGQRRDAIAITAAADTVIASSRHLGEVCAGFARTVHAVPDNVDLRLLPAGIPSMPFVDGRLQVWWSGVATKLFEFLAIEEVLTRFAGRVHLHLVTDLSPGSRSGWSADLRDRFESFLERVPHTFHPFTSIPDLLALYSRGGVIVSPRFLEHPYNLGHTEWKITLGLACGLPALASPVPSYRDAAALAGPGAIRICETPADWAGAFESALSGGWDLTSGAEAARRLVRDHYSTAVIASRHWSAVSSVLA